MGSSGNAGTWGVHEKTRKLREKDQKIVMDLARFTLLFIIMFNHRIPGTPITLFAIRGTINGRPIVFADERIKSNGRSIFAGAEPLLSPAVQPETHPELTNREKWLDYLRSNPLGKLFGLYQDLPEAGIDFDDFDLNMGPLELHHGTGPVVIPLNDPLRFRRELTEKDWSTLAQKQYDERSKNAQDRLVSSPNEVAELVFHGGNLFRPPAHAHLVILRVAFPTMPLHFNYTLSAVLDWTDAETLKRRRIVVSPTQSPVIPGPTSRQTSFF